MTDTVTFVMSWFILMLGLSYLLQQKMWFRLVNEFSDSQEQNRLLPLMMLLFIFGLAVIVNHNIWEMSMRVVITVFGWSMTIKGGLYLIWPQFAEKLIPYFQPIMKTWIWIAGVIISLLGLVLVVQYGLAL